MGGVFGADGTRSLLFDADGTRSAVRQRALAEDETRPLPVRRVSASAAAPGHTGRKRGEIVRTRMTVQQRHTSEWLGTFGGPGNGDANEMLERVCLAVRGYLDARGLPASLGVVRVDGEHGWLHRVARVTRHGLGYLVRCCDYKILKDPALCAALAAGAIARTIHEDTGVERELFDLPAYAWTTLRHETQTTRLVIARRRFSPDCKPSIGKRVGEWIYELIATDRPASQWDAAQVFALYLERGAFERTFGEEDQELPTDRWVSYQENGEEMWQILCQWLWNLRLRTGAQALRVVPDRDVFDTVAEAIHGEAVTLGAADLGSLEEALRGPDAAPVVVAGPAGPAGSEPVTEARADGESRPKGTVVRASFGTGEFRQRDAHRAVCPAGVEMHAAERRYLVQGYRIRYAAPAATCAKCTWSLECRGSTAASARGHRVTMHDWPPAVGPSGAPPTAVTEAIVVVGLPSSPPSPLTYETRWEPTPLWFETLRAGALRRHLPTLLRGQRVHCECVDLPAKPPPPPRRSQRAKRRTRWLERWGRNFLTTRRCTITLAGISDELAKVLHLQPIFAG